MEKLIDALVQAEEKKMCVQWGCTTCGAQEFKKLIQEALQIETLLSKEAALKISEQLKAIESIQYQDSVIFLIRICATRLSEDDLSYILSGTPCGDLYQRMLDRKRIKDAARRDHERRNDPEFIKQNREQKKNERAEAHQERLKLKAERDAKWQEKNGQKNK